MANKQAKKVKMDLVGEDGNAFWNEIMSTDQRSKGGKVCAARMSAAQRIERARMAGRASGLARKRKAAERKRQEAENGK